MEKKLIRACGASGVAKSYLSKIERHIQSNPSIQFLEKVAEALGVSIDDFIQEQQKLATRADVDEQWYPLIREVMESGVSKGQFREFLEFNKWKMGHG